MAAPFMSSLRGSTNSKLLGLDPTTLATKYSVFLRDPRNGNPAAIPDDGTASPMVAPDGDVYFGVLGNPGNGSRGFLLHFSGDLSVVKTPGAFGWDYTPGIVPASSVPSYTGSSAYLLFCKYNDYPSVDGSGVNRVALLDPNATQIDPHSSASGLVEMREVLTVIGPTPDPEPDPSAFPNAVKEWCINAPAVNPATKSVFFTSEDGRSYRWNLVTNTLDQAVVLTPGIGEPYVPTVIGPDGTVYTLNGGTLFALGNVPGINVIISSSSPDLRNTVVGSPITFTATVTGSPATPSGTVTFTDLTYDGLTPVATTLVTNVPLGSNGQASVTTSSLAAGSGFLGNHFITATYNGDASHPASSVTMVQKVHANASTIVLASSPNPSSFGQAVSFTATVSSVPSGAGTPTGMVTFQDGATVIGQVPLNSNGIAAITRSNLTPGNHSMVAIYSSDTKFAASATDPTNFTVTSPANVSGTKTKAGGNTPASIVTYNVVLSNGSSSAQMDNPGKEFTDPLPSSLTLVSASATSGTATATIGTNTVSWNGGIAGNGSVTITITATINNVPDGTSVSNQGTISYDADGNGTNEASRLTDDPSIAGPSDPTTFKVNDVNDAPDAVDDVLSSVAEDSGMRTISIASLLANDTKGPANESGQTLTLTGVSNPVGGTVSSDATNVYFTPAADFNGAASFQYTVTDNGTTNGAPDPKSDTATVSFTITEVNDAPTANNDTLSNVAEDSGAVTIPASTLTANDSKGPANESGQTLSIKTVSNAVGGTVSIVSGNVVFTPTADYSGPASFDYTVEDNGTTNGVADPKTSGPATASFTITAVNDAPTAVNDELADVAEDSGDRTIPFAVLTANDSKGPADESGQTLVVKTVSNAVGGTVSIVGGNVIFTPTADYYGGASFVYTVEDNGTTNGAADPRTSAPAVVRFTITEVNDAPTANNDTLSNIAEDSGPRTIPFADLTGNDSKGPANESGQTLIVKTVSNAIGGTVSIVGGNVVFTPTADYNGPASFDYTVEDNGTTNGVADPKTSGTATVSFNITAVADAPSVTNATTNANTQTTSGLVISRNPADGAEVTHFKITGITGGTLFKNNGTTLINNGDFITFAEGNAGLKFTPGTSNGSFTVQASLSASDAGLQGGTATATITVNPLGGVIRFSAANYSVAEGAGFTTITVERTGDTSGRR